LRYVLTTEGSYDGFEICKSKIEFLKWTFHRAYPNFRFTWADVHNTFYNPQGKIRPADYRFHYPDASFDIVYAASVFTHMLPEATAHYFRESQRVLKLGGRCVFSFFLLDNYVPGRKRPMSFNHEMFNVDHAFGEWGDDFKIGDPQNPEAISAYRLQLIERCAADAGLKLARPPVPGMWSGAFDNWISIQDLLIFQHA
jgi:SAM-dependent methyltransferase